MPKPDLQSRADIQTLLEQFYNSMLEDPQLGFIFKEVAQIDLVSHLPDLTDFWEQVLLQANGYQKNVVKIHLDLHDKFPLDPAHFERWLLYFNQTIDRLFEGPVVEKAKQRALSIGTMLQIKIHQTKL